MTGRHRTPEAIAASRLGRWGTRSVSEMFWDRVDQSAGPDGCWLWTGAVDRDGYGRTSQAHAHRAAYILAVGPVPTGLHLDHLCRNRLCANPAHLEPVTQAENNRRSQLYVRTGQCKRGHAVVAGQRRCRLCKRITHAVYLRGWYARRRAETTVAA